jgi:MarR family transcriptional regulator, organic hydroperoxide resistance regulator
MNFEETASFMLAKVTTAFRNALERNMETIGLHSGQVFILQELWKKDGQRQVDIAARLKLSAPTINKTIKGLIDSGLVTRHREENDARSTRIFLTERGAAKQEQVEEQWRELEEEVVAGLTEAERLMIFELLAKMRKSFTGSKVEDEEAD